MRALRNTEVFTAERIVQRYLVKFNKKEVEGRRRPGKVVLSPEDESLKIYLKEQYLEVERNPCELVEKLASFTGIDERKQGHYLLNIVLTEPNPNRILEIFVEYSVPNSYPDDNGEEDEWLTADRVARMEMHGLSGDKLPHQYATGGLTIISSNNIRGRDGDEDDSDLVGLGSSSVSFSDDLKRDGNEDDSDLVGLDPSSFSFLDDLMRDNPFGPGFKIVTANNSLNGAAVMRGAIVDEDLEFAGEHHVSTWHSLRVQKPPSG